MAEVLNVQNDEPERTPGEEKAGSNSSVDRFFCNDSRQSWSLRCAT